MVKNDVKKNFLEKQTFKILNKKIKIFENYFIMVFIFMNVKHSVRKNIEKTIENYKRLKNSLWFALIYAYMLRETVRTSVFHK